MDVAVSWGALLKSSNSQWSLSLEVVANRAQGIINPRAPAHLLVLLELIGASVPLKIWFYFDADILALFFHLK